jgi:hypothetical protein
VTGIGHHGIEPRPFGLHAADSIGVLAEDGISTLGRHLAQIIPNQAASWLPGDDYYTNFHEGDPFIKIDEGYARLPGAGYEALHPEVKGLNPEDYPDIHKMSILADVAPYSREYHTYRQKVGSQAQGNTQLEIEYETNLNRVKKTRESVIKMNDRHFTAPVDEISGTVDEVSAGGITLNEYPGRRFQFSSVSTSAADMSARILGENNNLTRSEVAAEVDTRRGALQEYLSSTFTSGDTARLVIPKGAAASSEQIRAVVLANGENVNRELIDRGYGEYREDLGGAEARAMHGVVGRHLGSMAEGLAFQGDSGPLNPMRYQGSPSCRTQRTSRARQKPGSHSPLHHPPGIWAALNKSTGCCRHFRLAGPQTPSLSTPETRLCHPWKILQSGPSSGH